MTADREQVYGAGFTRIPELAGAGIPVWLEVRYAAAHSKVMIIDADTRESVVITGSFNWTSAAQRKNAENLLIVRRNRSSRWRISRTGSAGGRRRFRTAGRRGERGLTSPTTPPGRARPGRMLQFFHWQQTVPVASGENCRRIGRQHRTPITNPRIQMLFSGLFDLLGGALCSSRSR